MPRETIMENKTHLYFGNPGNLHKLKVSERDYANYITLPDETITTLNRLYSAGTFIRHIKSDQLYMVEHLGKIEMDDGSWRTAVFYRPLDPSRVNEYYARDFRQVAAKFTPVKRLFEIWAGEYKDNGTVIPVTKLGEVEAYCFFDACVKLYKERGIEGALDLSGTRPYVSGYSNLYLTEADARRG